MDDDATFRSERTRSISACRSKLDSNASTPDRANESSIAEMRQALHAINNSLHVLGLQVELARLHLENGNVHDATAALEQALRERNNCGETTRSLQGLLQSP